VEFGTSSSEEYDAPAFLDSNFVLKQLRAQKKKNKIKLEKMQKLLHIHPVYKTHLEEQV